MHLGIIQIKTEQQHILWTTVSWTYERSSWLCSDNLALLVLRIVCVCVCMCVCVCVCVCVFGHVYVVYEDTNLYNDMGMT